MQKKVFARLATLAVIVTVSFAGAGAYATHSWAGYHWARTANPFTLKLGDNVSSQWDAALSGASSDWSASTVLNTTVVAGATNPKNCKAVTGRVEVCNSRYGNNGWLGIASIWASGLHITKGTVKVNDTYFNTPTYGTPAWRNLVLCQEIGHTIGLDHQDENFNNAPLGTCMDYTNDPTPNQHPNQHDYNMLETIYAHLDATTTVGSALPFGSRSVNHDDVATWGKELRTSRDGRVSLFERDYGRGEKEFTFVTWAK